MEESASSVLPDKAKTLIKPNTNKVIGTIEIVRRYIPGIFQTEGFEESRKPYADAFGLEPKREVVQPHFIEHNKIPAGFMADAADMAPFAALLCSPLARFMVGQNIVIDGGQHYSIF